MTGEDDNLARQLSDIAARVSRIEEDHKSLCAAAKIGSQAGPQVFEVLENGILVARLDIQGLRTRIWEPADLILDVTTNKLTVRHRDDKRQRIVDLARNSALPVSTRQADGLGQRRRVRRTGGGEGPGRTALLILRTLMENPGRRFTAAVMNEIAAQSLTESLFATYICRLRRQLGDKHSKYGFLLTDAGVDDSVDQSGHAYYLSETYLYRIIRYTDLSSRRPKTHPTRHRNGR